ncbi:MAG: 50S ribosomal protein L23 [bacterium]|nr:50S ribosomal protein L23 [bacterium]
MALFGRKKSEPARTTSVVRSSGEKKKETEVKDTSTLSKTPAAESVSGHLADVLRSPRITEKGASHMGVGVYTFDVADRATKRSIAEAVYEIYKVRPRMVHIVTIPRKTRRNARTGQYGMSRGGKKAYVYLKKGESITIT